MNALLTKLKAPLDINQIDFRVQSITAKGFATILAYKDARVDMNRLDEVCGALWQDEYELIDGQLFCKIGIKIGEEWVWRQDVGIESNTEATKGRASDAFKRAAFRWGIGRELYDYPRIQLMLKQDEFTVNGNKGKQTYKLKLEKWKWNLELNNDGSIKRLLAHDENGLRFDSSKEFNGAPTGGNYKSPQTNQQSQQQRPAAQQPQQNTNAKPSNGNTEKPWLNKMKGKDFTREWLNVIKAINNKSVTSIDQVKQYYKVSKETEAQLNEVFNFQPV